MMQVRQVLDVLNAWAPVETAMSWDNPGLLVGSAQESVTGITAALDCTTEVIDEARACGANLIVTHHPIIFHPLKQLTAGSYDSDRVTALVRAGISVISMHTNLDAAAGGVNDCLAAALGLAQTELLPGGEGIARMGVLPGEMETEDFLRFVCERLGLDALRSSQTEKTIRRVAVGGGACGDYLGAAAQAGCDAFVTADCRHHEYLEAGHLGLLLVDATHYATENVVVPEIARRLTEALGVPVLRAHTENPVRSTERSTGRSTASEK